MSVAGVVAAPKQPGRKGSSTPVRRLGWHALARSPRGRPPARCSVRWAPSWPGAVPIAWAVGVWAVLALAYGLHEMGLVTLPAPMRRRQLPRHLRRSMAPWKVSLLFGAMIGPGFVIFIRSSAYYLLVLGVIAADRRPWVPRCSRSSVSGVACRACSPIVHTRRGDPCPDSSPRCVWVDRRVQVVTGAALVALAALAGVALI